MTQAARFRELLRRDGMVVAPGAYDCITARLIERAGFEAVYMTGAGTAATLGYPDFGIVVAGIHIEDQEFPKKCGHLDDKRIVPREDWVAKIRAAAQSRRSADFLIIARTDSRAVAGFDEAIGRANAAIAAGADMAFVEAPQTVEEVAAVPRLVKGPCLLNVVRGGKTPDLDLREAESMGYKLAIVPGLLIKNVVGICEKMLDELRTTHRHPAPVREMSVRETFQLWGADEWDALRTRFRDPADSRREAAE